jgi:hypothetical protein
MGTRLEGMETWLSTICDLFSDSYEQPGFSLLDKPDFQEVILIDYRSKNLSPCLEGKRVVGTTNCLTLASPFKPEVWEEQPKLLHLSNLLVNCGKRKTNRRMETV